MVKSPIKTKPGKGSLAETKADDAGPMTFVARANGWVAGKRVKAGDTVLLSKAAAKYEPVDPSPPASAEVVESARLSKPVTELGAS